MRDHITERHVERVEKQIILLAFQGYRWENTKYKEETKEAKFIFKRPSTKIYSTVTMTMKFETDEDAGQFMILVAESIDKAEGLLTGRIKPKNKV